MQTTMSNIQLNYFGKDVHNSYSLPNLINAAEYATKNNDGFMINYITNYIEELSIQNSTEIADIPDINVIGRFTKGYFSGANIPYHTNKANFVYIQQASITLNWSDTELIYLALSFLKAYISMNDFIDGKVYSPKEKINFTINENVNLLNWILSLILDKIVRVRD